MWSIGAGIAMRNLRLGIGIMVGLIVMPGAEMEEEGGGRCMCFCLQNIKPV